MESSTVSMEQEFQDYVSDDLVNEAAKQNLLPASPKEGWEGVLNKFELRTFEPLTQKGEPNALYGHRIYRVTIDLYIDGKTRPPYSLLARNNTRGFHVSSA